MPAQNVLDRDRCRGVQLLQGLFRPVAVGERQLRQALRDRRGAEFRLALGRQGSPGPFSSFQPGLGRGSTDYGFDFRVNHRGHDQYHSSLRTHYAPYRVHLR